MQSNNAAVRRVTGSSDIPITAEGARQTNDMAEQYSEPFDHVFCGPEQRSIETAEHFGDPIILKGLDAWFRGAHEGKLAKSVKYAMRMLILKPDSKPPGKSPISGKEGETYNAFLKPLLAVMRTLKEHLKTGERFLVVTSGGNLQAIDQMANDDFAAKPDDKHYREIAQKPYWSAVGTLFYLTDSGLKKVTDDKKPGIYATEHAATAFNPPPADSKNGGGPKSKQPEKKETAGAPETHDYSSTQANLPKDIADKIREFGAKVPNEHLAKDGRETEPHVTLLWGIHSADPKESAEALKSHKPISAVLRHTSLFPASEKHPEHDVLKIEVHSPDLHTARGKLAKAVKNTQTFPSYHPHVTVAYLAPGQGKKYSGRMIPGVSGKKVNFDHVEFSSKDGNKTKMPLHSNSAK